jgi:hypothetical protein
MSLFLRASTVLTLLGCAIVTADSSERTAEELSDLQIDRALEAIWVKSPNPKQSSPSSAKRSALASYITSLGPGTAVITTHQGVLEKEAPFPPSQFHAEVIASSVGYIRIGTFEDELPQRLEHELRDFLQIGVRNVMVDLRATSVRGTLSLAGEVAGCFLPEGTEVFQIRDAKQTFEVLKTQRKPVAQFRLIVLTGERTAGPAEAFAAALRSHGGALIIGVSTRGQAADFELVPLGKERFLRMPVREAIVDGAPHLVPDGLHPDIICNATPEATDEVLLKEQEAGRIAAFLNEKERPRLNEAALVANQNPETEAWIQAQLTRNKPKTPATPKDAALTLAMDFLTGWEAMYGRTTSLP